VRRRAAVLHPTLRCAGGGRQEVRKGVGGGQETQGVETCSPDPSIGPIRAAVLLAFCRPRIVSAPKRQLWTYSGFWHRAYKAAAGHRMSMGVARVKKQSSIRGLNRNCNHDLKNLFKARRSWPRANPVHFKEFYTALLTKGLRPELARLTVARKIATIVLTCGERSVLRRPTSKPQTA